MSIVFQSTPSARRATRLSPDASALFGISIHALREEGDVFVRDLLQRVLEFQSTPSARRATSDTLQARSCRDISIHALREEGDQ